MPITNPQRDYSTRSSLLELSGAFAGQLRSIEGGDATSDVIREKVGSEPVVRKHLAGVRYTDIELECDAGMERTFFDWIRDTLNPKFTRKSGAISFLDFNYQVEQSIEFSNALLTSVSFPALDVASKDAVTMIVKLTPEYARREKGAGQRKSLPSGPKGRGRWTAANFRLKIDGLDCTHVTRIEPLVFTTVVAQNAVGEQRDYQMGPTYLDVPDLVLTVSESGADSFHAWHDDFVIKGMNGSQYEKNGTLEFLDPNMKDVMLTLELNNLGIFRLASVKPSLTDGTASVRAWMYCEEIRLGGNGLAEPEFSPSPARQEVPVSAAVPAPAGPAVPAAATGVERTPLMVADEEARGLMRIRPVDVQTEPVDVPADDGIGTTPVTASVLPPVLPGASITQRGVRGPSKPAWFRVTMPCDDRCVARVQMTEGPAFDIFGPSFQTPLARGVTIYDVPLQPALTQVYVNVPAGPWARYNLAISRDPRTPATSPAPSGAAAESPAGPALIAPANGQELPHDLAMTRGAATRFLAPYHLTSFGLSDSDVMTTFPITLTVKLDRPADVDIPIRLFLDRAFHGTFVVHRGSDTATTLLGTSNVDLGQHTLTVRLAGEPGDDNEELSRTLNVSGHLPAAFHQ
jgi:hypothetical protein